MCNETTEKIMNSVQIILLHTSVETYFYEAIDLTCAYPIQYGVINYNTRKVYHKKLKMKIHKHSYVN